MFQIFLSSPARSKYLSLFSLYFILTQWFAETAKSTWRQVFFLFLCLLLLVFWSGSDDLFVYKNSREFNALPFQDRILVCSFSIWQYGQILISCTICCGSTFQPSFVKSFCAILLHSLIKWWIASFLSQDNLHLLLSCVLSISAFIWLVFIRLFSTDIRWHSLSHFKFPFRSHIQVVYKLLVFHWNIWYHLTE